MLAGAGVGHAQPGVACSSQACCCWVHTLARIKAATWTMNRLATNRNGRTCGVCMLAGVGVGQGHAQPLGGGVPGFEGVLQGLL